MVHLDVRWRIMKMEKTFLAIFLVLGIACTYGGCTERPIKDDVYDMMCDNPNLKLCRKDPSKTRINAFRLLKKFNVAVVKCVIKGTLVKRVVSFNFSLLCWPNTHFTMKIKSRRVC